MVLPEITDFDDNYIGEFIIPKLIIGAGLTGKPNESDDYILEL